MASTITLKRSAVAGKVPTTSDLALGELAINTYDGKAFIKKSANGTDEIVELGNVVEDFVVTKRVISEDYTLADGYNMMSINDVEVEQGVTVEVADGSTWVVVG